MHYMRLIRADSREEATGKAGTPIAFTAVTPGKKRDGVDTAVLPWSTERFLSNPVCTWSHDFVGNRLPIGRAEVQVLDADEGESIRAEILFDQGDEFAREVERKYRDGFLHAVSVSWDDVDGDGIPARVSGKKAVAHDLLEIAAVPVPGDPAALVERQVTALRSLREDIDAVLADTDDESPAPDDEPPAPEDEAQTDEDDSADDDADEPEAETDQPDDASQDDEDLWSYAAAVMVDVFDRGSDDSDEKRRRAYNALLPAYRRLGKEPPEWVGGDELRALDDDNWRALFLSGELVVAGSRAGAELSTRNVQDLTDAVESIQAGVDRIAALLERVAEKNRTSANVDDESGSLADVSRWLDTRLSSEEVDDDPTD